MQTCGEKYELKSNLQAQPFAFYLAAMLICLVGKTAETERTVGAVLFHTDRVGRCS